MEESTTRIICFLNSNRSNSGDLINLNKALLAWWCKSYIMPLPPHLVPTSIAFHFFFFFHFTLPPRTLFLAFSSSHERGLGGRGFNRWNVIPVRIRREGTIVLTKKPRNIEVVVKKKYSGSSEEKKKKRKKKREIARSILESRNANSSIHVDVGYFWSIN